MRCQSSAELPSTITHPRGGTEVSPAPLHSSKGSLECSQILPGETSPLHTFHPPKSTSSYSGAAVVFANPLRGRGSARCPRGCCVLHRQVTFLSGKLWLCWPGDSCSRGNRCFVPGAEELSEFCQIQGSRELRSALSLGCGADFIVSVCQSRGELGIIFPGGGEVFVSVGWVCSSLLSASPEA